MEINQGLYPAYLLASVVLGVALGVFYDGFRILRIVRGSVSRGKMETVLLFWEDLFFSVVSAVSTAILSYAMNRGRIRWFSLLAMAIGFWIYRKTVSKAVIAGVIWLRNRVISAYHATIGRLLIRLRERSRLIKKRKQTKRLLARLIREAEQGSWE